MLAHVRQEDANNGEHEATRESSATQSSNQCCQSDTVLRDPLKDPPQVTVTGQSSRNEAQEDEGRVEKPNLTLGVVHETQCMSWEGGGYG